MNKNNNGENAFFCYRYFSETVSAQYIQIISKSMVYLPKTRSSIAYDTKRFIKRYNIAWLTSHKPSKFETTLF